MKPHTQTIGKRVDAVAWEEMPDLRAELDDFVRRVPTLSQTELIQAKEKLIQKLASTTTNRALSPFRADVPYGIMIALAAALLTILRPPARLKILRHDLQSLGDHVKSLRDDNESRCARIDNVTDCEKKKSCGWCPQCTLSDGRRLQGHCCDVPDLL